ncbi:MAG: Rrf2 family transcriptional regulator [Sulfurimonas sp.]|nr:MAG: Rrf2 family transcriptional regulator [Sulfurimonas sp.]
MSLISSKGLYGLAAMYELHLRKSAKPVQIKEISEHADIPQNYLEQLLGTLRKAGLVSSTRGAHGGYHLARDSKEIVIRDIFEALEGHLSIVESSTKNPALALFYEEKTKELEALFDLSLADLTQYQQLVSKQICYSI